VLEIKIPFYSTLRIRSTDFFDEGQVEGGKTAEIRQRKWMLMIVTASACVTARRACRRYYAK